MFRGAISNVGSPCVWFMSEVLFKENQLREDRASWLRRACVMMRVVVIIKPGDCVPETDLPLEFRVFRFLQDAQFALSRDSEPLFLVTENINDITKETFSFSESMFDRYQVKLR